MTEVRAHACRAYGITLSKVAGQCLSEETSYLLFLSCDHFFNNYSP